MPSFARNSSIVLLVAAGLLILLSAPCFLLGVLGLLGVVADMGAAENREAGVAFLTFGLIPAGIGAVLLVVALLLRRRGLQEASRSREPEPPSVQT